MLVRVLITGKTKLRPARPSGLAEGLIVRLRRSAMNRERGGQPTTAAKQASIAAKATFREECIMAQYGVTRRGVLGGALATTALSATGTPVFADPQWKKFAGSSLEVSLTKGP